MPEFRLISYSPPPETVPLMNAMISQESAGKANAVSPKGAQGLMQLMGPTAKEMAAHIGLDSYDAFRPLDNVVLGNQYVSELQKRYGGDINKTLAAYNAGPGAVDKYGGIPPYPETQNYVKQITGNLPPQQAQNVTPQAMPEMRIISAPQQMQPQNLAPVLNAQGQTQTGAEAQQAAAQAQQDAAPSRLGQVLSDTGARIIGSLPFDDEIAGGLRSLYSGQPYAVEKQNARQLIDAAKSRADQVVPPIVNRVLEGTATLPLWLAAGEAPIIGGAFKASKAEGYIPAALQGGKIGGSIGATYGAGEGDTAYERLMRAGFGGALGSLLGVGGGLLSEGLSQAAKSELAQRLYEATRNAVGNEAGAALPVGARAKVARLPELTKAERAIMEATRNTPPEAFTEGALGASSAQYAPKQSFPVLAAEATQAPEIAGTMRALANDPASVGTVAPLMDARAVARRDRLGGLLDVLGPEQTPDDAYRALQQGMQNQVKGLKVARQTAAEPFYSAGAAEAPLITEPKVQPALDKFLASKDVKAVMNDVRSRFPAEYGDLPDNHIALVDKAKKVIANKIAVARRAGETETARDFSILKGYADEAIASNPQYKEGIIQYAKMSPAIEKLQGSKDARGLYQDFIGNKVDPNTLGKKLFARSPNQLRLLKEALGPDRKNLLVQATRAYFEEQLGSQRQGVPIVRDLIKGETTANKLKAVLGDDIYKELMAGIEAEFKIIKGSEIYTPFTGSQTANVLLTKQRLSGIIPRVLKFFSNLATGNIKGTAGELANIGMTAGQEGQEQLYREMAQALFDPKQSVQTFTNIGEYRALSDARRAAVEQAAQALKARAAQGAGEGSTILTKKRKR